MKQENDNKTLHLNLKRKWYDLIESGIKTEEYRDLKDYFYRIFINRNVPAIQRGFFSILYTSITSGNYKEHELQQANILLPNITKDYKTITFSNGYAKDRDQFVIELKGIEIKEGNPDWGAEAGKKYFVLHLGHVKQS